MQKKSVIELNRVMDVIRESKQAIDNLLIPAERLGDIWLTHHVVNKLDLSTRLEWEREAEQANDFPTFDSLISFLERLSRILEAASPISSSSASVQSNQKSTSSPGKSKSSAVHSTEVAANQKNASCILCRGSHYLFACQNFKKMILSQRLEFCKKEKLCLNCLQSSHFVKDCKSTKRCFVCQGKHHTKLHDPQATPPQQNQESTAKQNEGGSTSALATGDASSVHFSSQKAAGSVSVNQSVVLATASIVPADAYGNEITVRALIDPGAQRSFLTERVLTQLSLHTQKINHMLSGVGAELTSIARKEVTSIFLLSRLNQKFKSQFSALVLDKLTRLLPTFELSQKEWQHTKGLELADPLFFKPSRVDCILGADVFPSIINEGLIKGPVEAPVAQNTVFGWILSGPAFNAQSCNYSTQVFHTYTEPPLDKLLEKFWQVEEVPTRKALTAEEQSCEEHFRQTYYRNAQGRFVVRLPFATQTSFIGSRDIAVACLSRSEKRLHRNTLIAEKYNAFMREYLELQHMELVPSDQILCESYYLPHHAVIREESQKIRVVFNASQKAVNKLSLNDVLLSGPKLQADITIVLTQWRFQRYVFITAIVKMFRQILIHPDDADWQRIVWRPSDTQPVRDYRALTVTYGTSPAPFLALRVLQQLAQDGRTTHPEASRLLRQQVYVDDIFGGADDIDTARQRRDQLIQLLATAGMELGKWSANEPALLQGLAVKNSIEVPVQTNEVVSTLGLKWLPQNDYFIFEAALPPISPIVSKRILLSDVARLFDPLGWISPVLITAKIIMQELWIQKIDWDSPIQGDTFQQWIQFRNSLSDLKIINVPRWVGCLESTDWQLHGFSDASKRAYAAAVYSVIPGQRSTLLMVKSRVAPTKLETLPRLEVCGALLLTRLTKHILSKLDRQPSNIYFWSDSKVVLDWLRGHPSRWQTFVANRVSEIVFSFPQAEWHHVGSSFNAADCATRGLTPQQLAEHKLWWSGPPWITSPRNEWPSAINEQQETQVLSAQEAVNESPGNHDCLSNLQRFSNFSKIRRILAYVARWRCNASHKANERQLAFLTAQELSIATTYCYRAIQRRHFSAELDLLRANKPVHKRSSVARLAPFIDENDLLRVSGRLGNAPLPYNERHPIILPGNEIIVKQLVREIHVTTLHGGVQLMCSQLRQTVWITRGHDIVTRVFRACCKCSRHNSKVGQQQMAPLPATRVTPQRPFAVVGLDYAGPVPVLFSRGRGAKSTKGYVSIFVCFAVRAVHIENVSDLTAQAFLAAFDRFTARRGLCHTIYSDNVTTFKGASAELTRMFAEASNFNQQVACQLANRGTTWKFIPPRAPHFGGLWEAAVRRFKYHFKRVIGEATLTFEELSTLAAKIEACMNSRPLCPLSTEPTELAVLTPGHFLVGSPLLSHPEAVAESPALRGRSRWHLLCQMRNSFWQRWRNEVLHHLQQRNKWLQPQPNLQVNNIVLLKDELAPPARWPLGRITALHPGGDGLVRAVTVKTADSSFVRPIVKLVKLPADSDTEE